MTTTAEKRKAFPTRYARKDARTRIYRALFGKSEWRFAKDPVDDNSRKLPTYWDHQTATKVFESNIEIAAFDPARRTQLQHRLNSLKHYQPKQS